MYMTKVSASQFKAKLGVYMQAVRAGRVVLITDRGVPVARLEPIELRRSSAPAGPPQSAPVAPSGPPLGDVKVKSIAFRGTDSLALLRADRGR